MEDKGFRLPSVPATTTAAFNTASQVIQWTSKAENEKKLDTFSKAVVGQLQACLPKTAKLRKTDKEAMWRNYYRLRTSASFQSLWKSFLTKDIGAESVQPLFYQYVVEKTFQMLLEVKFQTHISKKTLDPKPLTYEEGNALRYVAGYVCHKVRKKITESKHPMKDKLLLCLMDLCDEDEEVSNSADWVHAVDRGGLTHVSENTYQLFERMEMIVRTVFNEEKAPTMSEGVKGELHSMIVSDDDIAFYWCMLTVEVEEAEGKVLLGMITELYINVRGFSFSKSLMEMYKQETKRCTQKAKSLRRKLPTGDGF